jgi:hypothetical protein
MLAAGIRRQIFAASQKFGSTKKKRFSYRLLEAITRLRTSCYMKHKYFCGVSVEILIFISQSRLALLWLCSPEI